MYLWRYSTIGINVISLFITMLIFSLVNLTSTEVKKINKSANDFNVNLNVIEEAKEKNDLEQVKTTEKKKEYIWFLEIPKIDLKAEIEEGTTKEIMNKYIGHFEETSKFEGNVGLAAHNRGYENNYFKRLKELKEGDVVKYYYKDNIKEYVVDKHEIIKDTNWTNLEETEDNRITLITCVENQPEFRRCIQAIEKRKEVD